MTNGESAAPMPGWRKVALSARRALDELGYQTPRCLPGEPEECGGGSASHAVSYFGALRAVAEDRIRHLHDDQVLQTIAENAYHAVAEEIDSRGRCDHPEHEAPGTRHGLPWVRGNCPMGCGQTLFLGDGGHITCSKADCPRPSAVDELLHDRETEHIVELGETSFTVRHPLRERLDDALMECGLHSRIAAGSGPPVPPGRYRACEPGVGGVVWERTGSPGGDRG